MNNPHSQFLLRRFSFDKMKEDINNIVDYELNPCEFDNVDDFISEACDLLAYRYFEDSKLLAKNYDYYLTNSIARASRVLNKCSAENSSISS